MQILRAYSGLGNDLPQAGLLHSGEEKDKRPEKKEADKGDTVHLSVEAREALAGGEVPLSVQAADATYDQYGNVTRQIDSLQGELRSLASSLMKEGTGLAGPISQMQSQLRTLRARV